MHAELGDARAGNTGNTGNTKKKLGLHWMTVWVYMGVGGMGDKVQDRDCGAGEHCLIAAVVCV